MKGKMSDSPSNWIYEPYWKKAGKANWVMTKKKSKNRGKKNWQSKGFKTYLEYKKHLAETIKREVNPAYAKSLFDQGFEIMVADKFLAKDQHLKKGTIITKDKGSFKDQISVFRQQIPTKGNKPLAYYYLGDESPYFEKLKEKNEDSDKKNESGG